MRLDQLGPEAVEAPPPRSPRLPPDLERLRRECRRQTVQLGLLTEAVSTLRRGAKALKAENVELRAQNARLRAAATRQTTRPEGAELADVTLPLDARAPGLARTVIAGCLAEHVSASVLDAAQLIVSELVTNSLVHSGTAEGEDVVVRGHLWRGACRLEVEDQGSDGVIAPRDPDPVAGGGMGLNLVQTLSLRWGVIRGPEGPTRVWAQLPCVQPCA